MQKYIALKQWFAAGEGDAAVTADQSALPFVDADKFRFTDTVL